MTNRARDVTRGSTARRTRRERPKLKRRLLHLSTLGFAQTDIRSCQMEGSSTYSCEDRRPSYRLLHLFLPSTPSFLYNRDTARNGLLQYVLKFQWRRKLLAQCVMEILSPLTLEVFRVGSPPGYML